MRLVSFAVLGSSSEENHETLNKHFRKLLYFLWLCCGLNLVLVKNFKTGSIFIFFCHVFISII